MTTTVSGGGEGVVDAPPMFSIMEYVAVELPFAEQLRVFAAAGADAMGVSLFRPPRRRRESLPEMAALVGESGTRVTYCWPQAPSVLPIPGFGGPDDWRARVDQMVEAVPDIARLGAAGMGCVTGPAGGLGLAEARQRVVDGLREVALAAEAAGVRVAIEPIHPCEREVFSFVSTIDAAARLIEDVGMPNVGMVVDIWHLDGQPDVTAEIERHVDLIDLVHVCDRRNPTRSTCDRVLPGDGVAEVVGMLRALRRSGYTGCYELEVLSDDGTFGNDFADSLWRLAPGDLVAAGKRKFLECYRRAADEGDDQRGS